MRKETFPISGSVSFLQNYADTLLIIRQSSDDLKEKQIIQCTGHPVRFHNRPICSTGRLRRLGMRLQQDGQRSTWMALAFSQEEGSGLQVVLMLSSEILQGMSFYRLGDSFDNVLRLRRLRCWHVARASIWRRNNGYLCRWSSRWIHWWRNHF